MTNLVHVHDNIDKLHNKCSKNPTVNVNATRVRRSYVFFRLSRFLLF